MNVYYIYIYVQYTHIKSHRQMERERERWREMHVSKHSTSSQCMTLSVVLVGHGYPQASHGMHNQVTTTPQTVYKAGPEIHNAYKKTMKDIARSLSAVQLTECETVCRLKSPVRGHDHQFRSMSRKERRMATTWSRDPGGPALKLIFDQWIDMMGFQ